MPCELLLLLLCVCAGYCLTGGKLGLDVEQGLSQVHASTCEL
jgi:hypothetical protein